MIVVSGEITTDLVTKRTFSKIMRLVNRHTMEHLKNEMLPDKFTVAGGREYDFEKRAKGYQIWKAKTLGHQKPLVRRGILERTVLGSGKVTATATRAKLTAKASFPLTPQRRRELEAVSTQDKAELEELRLREVTRLANKPQFRRRRKTKVKA